MHVYDVRNVCVVSGYNDIIAFGALLCAAWVYGTCTHELIPNMDDSILVVR